MQSEEKNEIVFDFQREKDEKQRKTNKLDPEHMSHFLICHSLGMIYVLIDSSNEFIEFVHKVYTLFEYDYEIIPIYSDEFASTLEWSLFSNHFRELFGNQLDYALYKKQPKEFQMAYKRYMKAFFHFHLENNAASHFFKHPITKTNEKMKTNTETEIKTETNTEKNTEKNTETNTEKDNKKKPTLINIVSKSKSEYNITDFYAKVRKGQSIDKDYESFTLDAPSKQLRLSSIQNDPTDWDGNYSPLWAPFETQYVTTESDDAQKTSILYDEIQCVTMVIQGDDCNWINKWTTYIGGMHVIKEYDELYCVIGNPIIQYFNMRQYNSMEDAIDAVKNYDLLNNLSKKRSVVEIRIRSYLLQQYDISTNPKKMMKASVLQELIENALLESTIGNTPVVESALADMLKFRKLISSVLLDMGLQKKRLSDGIYYYGISPNVEREEKMTNALDDIIKTREKHIENIIANMKNSDPKWYKWNICKQPNFQIRDEPAIDKPNTDNKDIYIK